jgi:uncharacterized protein YlzI (FlbEa/FlbD family)
MSARVPLTYDLHEPVFDILQRLGLEPESVARLDVTPREVVAEVYLLNENGKKYIDQESDEVAVKRVKFLARTRKADDGDEG